MMTISSQRTLVNIIVLRKGWPVQLPGSYDVRHGLYIACSSSRIVLTRKSAVFFSMSNLNIYIPRQKQHSEMTHTGIWLRESVSKMFNTARIPQKNCDILSTPPPRLCSLSARCLLVMFHNFCYTIPVYSPSGQLASPKSIYDRLRNLVVDVDARLKAKEVAFPIGILSADDRDIWAKVCDGLWSKYQTNHQLSTESSLLALALARK